jgi:hypothetical protein
MTEEEIHEFIHESVYELMEANELLQVRFKIGAYKRYAYDMDKETLVFSNHGVPGVLATIRVVGSISKVSGTWLWGWANAHFPDNVTKAATTVRDFGEDQSIWKLTKDKWEATEEDGWEMAAVSNRLMKAKGAYRCPDSNGFLFLILTDVKRLQ